MWDFDLCEISFYFFIYGYYSWWVNDLTENNNFWV